MTSTNSASITIGGNSGFQSIKTDDGITNKIVLNNFSEISDLITLNNSNFLNKHSNVTVNFNSNYRFGIINSNLHILKYNELLSENDSVFKVTNDDIIISHSNIVNNINCNFSINHNDENILLIDRYNSNLNISNYNFNYFIDNNTFNIRDTSQTDNTIIFGVESDRININCDLIVNKIFTKNIDSIDGKGINITNYQIEQNNFKKVSVGFDDYFTYNLQSTDDSQPNSLQATEETNVPDAPFIIVNNSLNYNTSNLFEIKKIYENKDEKILKIDNNGYMYMGNCIYNDKESYLTINNSNYDNYSNINNDLINYVSFSSDYYSDDFKINKYANVTIGSNLYDNKGLLDINRNDNRINLDINNSNNINENKPLLNLNLEYQINNNYKWNAQNKYIPYFTIFPSKEQNIEYDIQMNNYNYIDNYKLIYGLNDAYYEKWKILADKIPFDGVLIENNSLEIKLKEKYDNSEELVFTKQEWDQFNIENLNMKDYVLIGGNIYQPKEKKLDSNEMFYNIDGHKYYFLHGNYINAKLNYDYKKLNLQIVNNFNEKSTGVFTYDKSMTYNVLFNYYNLQYETEQIEYNFKTYYWKTDFAYHIFYPYKIIDNSKNGKEYILEIDDISANIPSKVQTKQADLSLSGNAIEYKYKHLFIYPTIPQLLDKDYTDQEKKERITFISTTNSLRDNLISLLATDTDMYTSNLFNLDTTDDIKNTTYYQYFQDFTSIRHIEVKATGLKWKKIIIPDGGNINNIIDTVWDNNTISNKMDYANLHPYNIEMKPFQHSSKDSLLITLRNTYELKNSQEDSEIISFNIAQNIWNNFNIEFIYCNEYIYDDINNYYYIPDEKIKVIFAIHFPLEFYNEFNSSVQEINDYTSNIIEQPSFINLTSNNSTILNINNDGTLIYDYSSFDNISNYSIYAPNKTISTNRIQLNEIYSSSNSIDLNNLYLNNIAGIVFNTKQEFDVSQLRVDKISNNNNNLIFDNTQFNLSTFIYGLRWKLVDYSNIVDIDTYTHINSGEFLGMFSLLIQENPDENEYEIDYNNLSILLKDFVKNNIPFKSYIVFDNNGEEKYYIQKSNEYKYSSNFLLYDIDNIASYEHLFYNDIIFINTNNDSGVKPALTIYGINPSINLKSDKNTNILYQQSILQKGFKNLSTAGITNNTELCDVFQINYYDNNNVLFDNNMYTNNSKHIVEHILGDYNILSFGENYNICIDTKGVTEPTFTDDKFGTIWVVDEYATTRINVVYENAIIDIFNFDVTNYEKNTIIIEKQFFETIGVTDLHEDNYVLYNQKKFKPYITTYSYNLARNSTNKNHKISLGVPHNNADINTALTDSISGLYLYNYPKYFNEIIKNNDYMLNIYGNTKIYGIDGDTNALSININDIKSDDNTYKVNLGIGINPLINNISNTLSIDGDIYAENLFYKNDEEYINITNIYSNVIDTFKQNLFNEELIKSYIHTSNINNNFVNDNGILDLSLIPEIPFTNFSTPEIPTKQIYLKNYLHPEISSSRIIDGTKTITDIDLLSLNYKTSTEVVYTNIEDTEKINIDYNKYFYFVLTNDYSEQESKLFQLKSNDEITADILIIAGGGGAGYIKPFLNWYEIQTPTIGDGTEYKNTSIETDLKNGTYIFSNNEYEDIKNNFVNSDDTDITDIDNFVDLFISNNDYIKVIINLETSDFKYFRTFDNGGGEGGNLSIMKNVLINKEDTFDIIIGSGGLSGNTTTKTESTSGTDSSILGITIYGGKNSSIFNNNNDIHPEIARDIYDFYYIYDNLGFNNSETDPTQKYFGGDGNSISLDYTIGGGGGYIQANSQENSGGGGGYLNGNWGNGANGLVIIRYKFNLKDVVVDTEIIENPTNALLQYNWQNTNWELNYDAIDVSNILVDTIYKTSNILHTNIDNFSNIIINTSNNIIDTIISSNLEIYDNINIITNIININDTNYSNYIDFVYDNTNFIGAERIISNIIDINRLPNIPFTKFNNLDIDVIYSPKVNDNIIIDTNYYLSNINYTSLTINNNDYEYTEYIVLKHNNISDDVTQTIYNLQFQLNTNIDILIIGGGGGGGGNVSYSGGGGGGAFILAKNIDIELNKKYEIIIGAGGLESTDGHSTSALGLITNGGKRGISQNIDGSYLKGIGGNGGIPDINNKFTEITSSHIIISSGGDGGSIDSTIETNIVYTLPNSGNTSDTFINDNDNREYYWGGGGGFGTNSTINSLENLPNGGEGGGGAGAFNSDSVIPSSNGDSYNNEIFTLDSGIFNGLNGSINSGGGGGGGSLGGTGGRGGSGVVIIKINSNIKPVENKKKKAYVSYNFNLDRWEMNSLDLLNLDINIDDIHETIKTSSNEVIDYVNSLVQREEYEYIIVPSNIVTNDSIVNNAIYSYNIFGYNGKSSNLTTDVTLIPDSQGLITIPSEGYTNPNNIYYKKLIHGNKFALQSITNNNIADNSISVDKLQGTITGSKLKDLSINYSDIIGDIYSHVRIINDSSSSDLIDVSSFNNITIDIELLDLTSEYKFVGLANILSNDDSIKIPINKFNYTNIYLSNIDLSENYNGTTYILSHTNDIDINYFENININVSNILDFGNEDFKINNVIMNGIIDKNNLENIYIHNSNLDTDTLTNTSVYLFGEQTVSPNFIKNLSLSANQIATGADFVSSLDVTLRLDGQTIDPALLSKIQITPQDISQIENSLRVELVTSYINQNGDVIEDKLHPRLLSNITISPTDLSNINNYSVKLSNVNIDTSIEKIHPDIIGEITLSPSDILNINNYSVKLSNVIINTGETAEEKINPNLIASITMSPDQFNSFGSFQSIKLEGLVDNSIDPILINHNSVTINANHIKTGINSDTGNLFKLPENMQYNFPDNSIDPILIPENIIIYGSNIDIHSGNKLESVIIEGKIKSSIIGDNVTITSNAIIVDDGQISGRVEIQAPINTSIIKNAVIHDGNNIIYTGTKIQRTEIFGNLDSEFIGDAEIRIKDELTSITGNTKFSGITSLYGNIDSGYIQNVLINLDDDNTSLMDGTFITGDVTITGIVNPGNINPNNGVTINIKDGEFNGSNLANESIPYNKLSSNLNIYVNEIKFNNGTSFTSAISDDLYSKFEVESLFVSKNYYNTNLLPIFDNNMIKLLLYNGGLLEHYKLPIYKNTLNELTISTYNSFYSLQNDKSIIEIKSNNDNANISIVSYYNTEYDKIGKNLLWENVGGSYFKVNSERLCFVLNNTDNTFELSNTSNFSYKPLYIPQLIFSDGTTMNTSAVTMLNSENQLIMNNSESGYTYSDNQVTGEGFIHCNGIHAEFDITAFSSTTKSDINLKKNINKLDYNYELLQLNPVTFDWKDKNKSNTSNVGFIAQEVEKILPCLVKDGLDNFKSVNYISLIPYLVKHIQTLEERIKKLETKY